MKTASLLPLSCCSWPNRGLLLLCMACVTGRGLPSSSHTSWRPYPRVAAVVPISHGRALPSLSIGVPRCPSLPFQLPKLVSRRESPRGAYGAAHDSDKSLLVRNLCFLPPGFLKLPPASWHDYCRQRAVCAPCRRPTPHPKRAATFSERLQ